MQQCSSFLGLKKPCTQHLWNVYPSHQAAAQLNTRSLLSSAHSSSNFPSSLEEPRLFLDKAMCHRIGSMEVKRVLFGFTATFQQTCPGLPSRSEQLQPPRWGYQELVSRACAQNSPGFQEGQTQPRKHGYKATSTYKMFWSFFCYPERQDIVLRPFYSPCAAWGAPRCSVQRWSMARSEH